MPASCMAMARACLRFCTTGPSLLPECNSPSLYSCITFSTLSRPLRIVLASSFGHHVHLHLDGCLAALNLACQPLDLAVFQRCQPWVILQRVKDFHLERGSSMHAGGRFPASTRHRHPSWE